MAAVKYFIPGRVQLAVIRAAVADGAKTCAPGSEMTAATKANGNGYLDRDPKNGAIWYPTDRGRAMLAYLAEREAEAEASLPAVAGRDLFGLVDTVLRAQKALDAGDIMAAKQLAGGAYLDAKARAQYAASFGAAGKRVLAKARQLQGDALLIETRAKMSMAAAWDAAQADGKAAKKGRPKNVGDDDIFTLDDAGLTRQEIHESRKLLEAEQRDPGFAERAIAARLAAGFEPSRRNLSASVGTKTATKEERGDNLYETPPEGMDVVLAFEDFLPLVLEPFCGRGAISRRLESEGHEVMLSDLVDYGTADRHGQVQQVRDFLSLTREEVEGWAEGEDFDLVSNPPYGKAIDACIAHALTVIKPRKMALLVNLNYLCGYTDDNRKLVLDSMPPERAIINAERLPMMHRDGWDGPKASSSMNTMWLVWARTEAGTYAGEFRIVRAVYSTCAAAPMAESEAA
jgi:hypothetical protein